MPWLPWVGVLGAEGVSSIVIGHPPRLVHVRRDIFALLRAHRSLADVSGSLNISITRACCLFVAPVCLYRRIDVLPVAWALLRYLAVRPRVMLWRCGLRYGCGVSADVIYVIH